MAKLKSLIYHSEMKIDLNLYRKNIYTNSGVRPCPGYGEDGVLEEIFRKIKVSQNPLCIEFGELRSLGTTTRSFKIKYFAKSLYFSGSLDLNSRILNILDVFKLAYKQKNVRYLKFLWNLPMKKFVRPIEISKTINYFTKNNEIDLLVCDIDSFDFEIIEEMLISKIRPRVLIVEYNPSLPIDQAIYWPETKFRNLNSNKKLYGASYLAWEGLLTQNGYSLVHISGFCNLHYIRKDIDHNFSKPNISVEITDTKEKCLDFAAKYCLPGFKPSWLDSPDLNKAEISQFSKF
jgi:hypothetical protein